MTTRSPDGSFVDSGQVVGESTLAHLFRWPSRFLPDSAENLPYWLFPFAQLAFWIVVGFLIFRLIRSFR